MISVPDSHTHSPLASGGCSVNMQELDLRGLQCPMPLLKAKQALNRLQSGDRLRVVATDPGSLRDFQTFARQSGHVLLQAEQDGELFRYELEKR